MGTWESELRDGDGFQGLLGIALGLYSSRAGQCSADQFGDVRCVGSGLFSLGVTLVYDRDFAKGSR